MLSALITCWALASTQTIGIHAPLAQDGHRFVPSGKHASQSRHTAVRRSGKLDGAIDRVSPLFAALIASTARMYQQDSCRHGIASAGSRKYVEISSD